MNDFSIFSGDYYIVDDYQTVKSLRSMFPQSLNENCKTQHNYPGVSRPVSCEIALFHHCNIVLPRSNLTRAKGKNALSAFANQSRNWVVQFCFVTEHFGHGQPVMPTMPTTAPTMRPPVSRRGLEAKAIRGSSPDHACWVIFIFQVPKILRYYRWWYSIMLTMNMWWIWVMNIRWGFP